MLVRRTFAAAVLALLCGIAAAEDPVLPPGVIARVYGKDIHERELEGRLVKRWKDTDRGRQVLDQLVDDLCVEREAKKRNVVVTQDEVAAFVKRVDEKIRRETGRTIQDVYDEQHATPEEFAASV